MIELIFYLILGQSHYVIYYLTLSHHVTTYLITHDQLRLLECLLFLFDSHNILLTDEPSTLVMWGSS